MTLGDFIKKYREQQHLSQRQFADRAGVSNGYIAMLERNTNPGTGNPLTPSLPKLKLIASAMGMTVHELSSYVDDMAVDLGTTIIDYEEAQEHLRIILTEPEYKMLRTYQAADDRARQDALSLLEQHPRRK